MGNILRGIQCVRPFWYKKNVPCHRTPLKIWFIVANYFDHQIGTLKGQYYLTLKGKLEEAFWMNTECCDGGYMSIGFLLLCFFLSPVNHLPVVLSRPQWARCSPLHIPPYFCRSLSVYPENWLKTTPFSNHLDQSVTAPSSLYICLNFCCFRKRDEIGEKKREEKKRERKQTYSWWC